MQKGGKKNRENVGVDFFSFSFRWTILPSDVSMPGGELGPTLKLKRFFFNKKYNDSIERLYVWFDLAMYYNLQTKIEFTVRYTTQITALMFFAILIFTDISIKYIRRLH